jgi:hypothetical protein
VFCTKSAQAAENKGKAREKQPQESSRARNSLREKELALEKFGRKDICRANMADVTKLVYGCQEIFWIFLIVTSL